MRISGRHRGGRHGKGSAHTPRYAWGPETPRSWRRIGRAARQEPGRTEKPCKNDTQKPKPQIGRIRGVLDQPASDKKRQYVSRRLGNGRDRTCAPCLARGTEF